jgi:hypothetical protein
VEVGGGGRRQEARGRRREAGGRRWRWETESGSQIGGGRHSRRQEVGGRWKIRGGRETGGRRQLEKGSPQYLERATMSLKDLCEKRETEHLGEIPLSNLLSILVDICLGMNGREVGGGRQEAGGRWEVGGSERREAHNT